MKLADLPAGVRLATGLFMLSLIYFYVHAQWTLWTVVGQNDVPTAERVLEKYHGARETSRLESVLDPGRSDEDELAMYPYLGDDRVDAQTHRARYDSIVAWVRGGATRAGWADVKPIFENPKLCLACHAPGGDMEGAPLVTYEDVTRFTTFDAGPSVAHLNKLSHSHLAGFALLAVVTSLLFTRTRYRMLVAAPLFVGAAIGPMLDVTGWWLTKFHGMPWPWLVIVGGALFGVSVLVMAILTLDELWLRGLLGRALGAIARPIGLRIRD